MKRKNRTDRKEQRRVEALARNDEYRSLPEEKKMQRKAATARRLQEGRWRFRDIA